MENGRLVRIPNATGFLTTELSGGSSLTFSADGKVLLVSERTTGLIDSFPVNANGTLGAATLTSYPGIFDFTTSSTNGLLITVGGPTISSTSVADNAKLTPVGQHSYFFRRMLGSCDAEGIRLRLDRRTGHHQWLLAFQGRCFNSNRNGRSRTCLWRHDS